MQILELIKKIDEVGFDSPPPLKKERQIAFNLMSEGCHSTE